MLKSSFLFHRGVALWMKVVYTFFHCNQVPLHPCRYHFNVLFAIHDIEVLHQKSLLFSLLCRNITRNKGHTIAWLLTGVVFMSMKVSSLTVMVNLWFKPICSYNEPWQCRTTDKHLQYSEWSGCSLLMKYKWILAKQMKHRWALKVLRKMWL